MFSIDRVKEEVTDENSKMSLPNSTEIKIEVKMEEIDPSGVTNYDNDLLDPDCAKIETDDVDIEDLYVKDEFDREIVKQELENNDAALSSPVVVVGSSGTTQNLPSKKLVIVPKKVYLDMKKKKKKTKKKKSKTKSIRCCVQHCRLRKQVRSQIQFYAFPKKNAGFVYVINSENVLEKMDRRKAWEHALLMDKPANSYLRVCSLHFDLESYATRGSTHPRLKSYAVPSLNLPTAVDAQKTAEEKHAHSEISEDDIVIETDEEPEQDSEENL